MLKTENIYDLIGIGVGPSNLGLAVMCEKLQSELKAGFFEKREKIEWHPGMMLKNSVLQAHYLKDLVTPIDPTSQYTFISYLVAHNRFFQFINRKTDSVSRKEFELYYQWVASNLNNLEFSSNIEQVKIEKDYFKVTVNSNGINDKEYLTKNIACGVGQVPHIPNIFASHISRNFFHNIDYLNKIKEVNLADKIVAIVGGGQSGAEVFYDLLCQNKNTLPRKIFWVSRRLNLQPVEDACFSRELFTPFYNEYFNSLPSHTRKIFLQELHLSGDGIDPVLLDEIYRKIYEITYLNTTEIEINLLPSNEVFSVKSQGHTYLMQSKNLLSDQIESLEAEVVICATGFEFQIPHCLEGILTREKLEYISKDYSITPTNLDNRRIYIQNGAKKTHGLADPYLSTAAWRNAVIINSILGKNFYRTTTNTPLLTWKNNLEKKQSDFEKLNLTAQDFLNV